MAAQPFRLNRIQIKNFKAIDHLEIVLPAPAYPGDHDVFVLGSSNGVGKTSILEAVGLVVWFVTFQNRVMAGPPETRDALKMPENLAGPLVRVGADKAWVCLTLQMDEQVEDIEFEFNTLGQIKTRSRMRAFQGLGGQQARSVARDSRDIMDKAPKGKFRRMEVSKKSPLPDVSMDTFRSLMGLLPEPALLPNALHLNSYRKVSEGLLLMNAISESPQQTDSFGASEGVYPGSYFKAEVLKTMLVLSNMVENVAVDNVEQKKAQFDRWLTKYANCRLGRLQFRDHYGIDIRLDPLDGSPSISIDNLSSGQKEMIATHFILQNHLGENGGLVLIDEPELHLNPEWQVGLVEELATSFPNIQFIMATHSEDIFAAVPPHKRLMLEREKPNTGRVS